MDHEPPQIDSTSIVCIECGYDLSGTAIGGRCPECGLPVSQTLRGGATTRSAKAQSNATTAMVLGILSLVVCAPLGFAAVYLGMSALRELKFELQDSSSSSMARAGAIMGGIGIVICLFAGTFICFGFSAGRM